MRETREVPETTETHEVYVDRAGNGLGVALGIIAAAVVALIVGWFVFQSVAGEDGDIDIPSEFNVDVDENAQAQPWLAA